MMTLVPLCACHMSSAHAGLYVGAQVKFAAQSVLHLCLLMSCMSIASSVCQLRWVEACCTPQAGVLPSSQYLSPMVPCVWLQTLQDTRVSVGLVGAENVDEPGLRDAKEEGVMCPALVELVCEALESSGGDAQGRDARGRRTPVARSSLQVVQQRMQAPV